VYACPLKTQNLIFLPVIALVTLFDAPFYASAQSILQSADGFTLLGGTSIVSTGPTTISGGNVGLWPTATSAITGFNATDGGQAVITPPGGIIDTGPITQQAMSDLMNAATQLDLMTSNHNLTGQDLGGLTLHPGVYTFDDVAAQALGTTLTLDAQGRDGVFWVFQINSTLTTGSNATVALSNLGANLGSDDGIFWDVGAAINIGTDNLMVGNYLAGTSITIDTNSSGSGRALAQAAISLDSNSINAQGGPGGSSWNGGLMYNNLGSIVAVPEPAAFLWLAPLGALSLAFWRRLYAAKPIST